MSANKRLRVWKDQAGEWRWTYTVSSDKVATAGEGYKRRVDALEQAVVLFPDATLEVDDGEGNWVVIADEEEAK